MIERAVALFAALAMPLAGCASFAAAQVSVSPTRVKRVLVSLVVALGAWMAGPDPVRAQDGSAPAAEDRDCTRKAGEGDSAPPLGKTVKLAPDTDANVVNFGGSRGFQFVDVVLNATPTLPEELDPDEIRLEALRRFTRTAEGLGTASTPRPTFTRPRISSGRDRITFTVCLNGTDLEAGSYSGTVLVEGPKGLAATSIAITQNAKDSSLAIWGSIGVLAAALLFLVLRGAVEREREAERNAIKAHAATVAKLDPEEAARRPEPEIEPARTCVGAVLKDVNWWVTSLVSLGLAGGTIYGLYSADPSWGADTLGSVIALVGPVFTAVGLQSVVTSLGRAVGR